MQFPLPIVTLDFETFYDAKTYTLKKLTTESYVRDPRFRVHGVAIRYPDNGYVQWHRPDDRWVENIEDQFGWDNVAVLCHHAQFDGLILADHYSIRPRMFFDTMAMGRVLLGNHVSVALGSLAKLFALGAKDVPYKYMSGKTWEQMDAALQGQVARGCANDVGITWDLFLQLVPYIPAEELALIDATVRMFTEPVLVGDTDQLGVQLADEQQRKRELLERLVVTAQELRSDPIFEELLEDEGVEIEYKDSKYGPQPCFAKTDQFMRDLCDDAEPRVAALAQARLEVQSAIVETRCQRLRDMSTRGPMCVYLNYCGAHTSRFSGGDKVNWQNFPRDSDLGKALYAPEGHLVCVNDASQIECRILNFVAGQTDVVERFRNKDDPYIGIASKFYGEPIYKAKDEDPRKAEMDAKRGTGKQLELSCGYGAGGPTIVATARKGTYGPPVFLDDKEGMRARDLYRSTHPAVQSLWGAAGDVLVKMHGSLTFDWLNCLHIENKRIFLPNGVPLIYETLEWCADKDKNDRPFGWRIFIRKENRKGWARMYGAKLVENVIQALSRVHVTQAWLRCHAYGIRMASMEHDKLIAVVPEKDADAALEVMKYEMCREPDWLKGIPLDSEGFISRTMKK